MILKTKPYNHQRRAVEKLRGIKVGALFMEMGTGKTRTALGLIEPRLNSRKVGHVLWLCPCNVKTNLRRDIDRHSDLAGDALTICGIETLSSSDHENARLFRIVTERRCFLIVDESLLVKNPYAIRSRHILTLAEQCSYKLILNGTPVSKTEADLYSQFRVLDWRILGYHSYWSFAANHLEYDDKYTGKIRRVLNADYLTDKIAPYTYQVTKEECLDLPKKLYQTFWFSFTEEQAEIYEQTKMEFLSASVLDTQYEKVAIYRVFTALKEVAAGRVILTSAQEPMRHNSFFSRPQDNPRIQALFEVLRRYAGEKTQAVIWCVYQHEINDITQALTEAGETVAIVTGDHTARQRQLAKDRFERGEARYLITNKNCAQFGLNLQYCHLSVYYDNDWDWATRAQSEDRIHRIGTEQRPVIVDICADSSIDERIMRCLARKSNMADEFRSNLKSKNYRQLADWIDGKGEDHVIDWPARRPETGGNCPICG